MIMGSALFIAAINLRERPPNRFRNDTFVPVPMEGVGSAGQRCAVIGKYDSIGKQTLFLNNTQPNTSLCEKRSIQKRH